MDDLNKLIAEMQILFLAQKRQIEDLKQRLNHEFNDVYDHQAFKIVKKVLYYIEHGVEENKALMLVFDENDLSFDYIQRIWKEYKPKKSGLLLYARCYAAHKMKQAGFSASEIALTLGLSVTTINKILKQHILLE